MIQQGQQLERLLALPEIGPVSLRGDLDFELLRLACAERLRRNPDVESIARAVRGVVGGARPPEDHSRGIGRGRFWTPFVTHPTSTGHRLAASVQRRLTTPLRSGFLRLRNLGVSQKLQHLLPYRGLHRQ